MVLSCCHILNEKLQKKFPSSFSISSSIHLSTYNNLRTMEHIFVKFYLANFYQNLWTHPSFGKKSDNDRHVTWRLMCSSCVTSCYIIIRPRNILCPIYVLCRSYHFWGVISKKNFYAVIWYSENHYWIDFNKMKYWKLLLVCHSCFMLFVRENQVIFHMLNV